MLKIGEVSFKPNKILGSARWLEGFPLYAYAHPTQLESCGYIYFFSPLYLDALGANRHCGGSLPYAHESQHFPIGIPATYSQLHPASTIRACCYYGLWFLCSCIWGSVDDHERMEDFSTLALSAKIFEYLRCVSPLTFFLFSHFLLAFLDLAPLLVASPLLGDLWLWATRARGVCFWPLWVDRKISR